MTFFQERYQENIGKNEPISVHDRAYQSQRFRQRVFARIAKIFAERAEEYGITKSQISTMLGKDKAQINRIMSFPTNLTLDTISEIALALNFEPSIQFHSLDYDPRFNHQHPCYNDEIKNDRVYKVPVEPTGKMPLFNITV